MDNVFTIDGRFYDKDNVIGSLSIKEIKLYINIPGWIEERNVYDVNTKKQIAVIKPKKFGGLSYYVYDIVGEFAKIKTLNFGECLVKITEATEISNKYYYESGNH